MKKILLSSRLWGLLFLMILLSACSKWRTDYRDDVDIALIQQAVSPLLAHPDTLIAYDCDEIHFFLNIPENYCTDSVVCAQSAPQQTDEYGVFHCNNSDDAEQLTELLETYLQTSVAAKQAWLADCGSEVTTANAHGKVRCYGNYVCYTVTDEATEQSIHETVKRLLQIP